MSARMLTITLTNEPPVRIDCGAWPIIAEAIQNGNGWNVRVVVRRARDGRTIVAGIAIPIGPPSRRAQRRAGELLETDQSAPWAIQRVATAVGAGADLARRAIAALPARALP